MLNIVIPMAGRGSRFVTGGYSMPKPLIPLHGKPIIEVVINNIKPKTPHRFIFLCLLEHIETYKIDTYLLNLEPTAKIVCVDKVTEGAACTVLLAKEFINNSDSLMIANSDQWVDVDINDYLSTLEKTQIDGLIMTMWADDPKWSYVDMDKEKNVTIVVEKQVISNEATVGIYNFKKGSDFVTAAEKMITQNLRVNNEFYVAPAYNILIEQKMKFGIYNVGKEFSGMYGLGIPQDLEWFAAHEISKKALHFKRK